MSNKNEQTLELQRIQSELTTFLVQLDELTRNTMAGALIGTIQNASESAPAYFAHLQKAASAEIEKRTENSNRPLEKIPRMFAVFEAANGGWVSKDSFIQTGVENPGSLNANFNVFREFLDTIGYKLLSEKNTQYKIVPIDTPEE